MHKATTPILLSWVALFSALGSAQTLAQNPSPQEQFDKTIKPFLAANCYVCHNGQKASGDIDLEQYKSIESIAANRDTWKLALQLLEGGEMPPKTMPARLSLPNGLPKPSEADRQMAVKWIKGEFERVDSLVKPQAGRITARRLNRIEYNNTIHDLLGVNMWPADDFPQDDAAHGFDNMGDSLSISPVLMEKYLNAAEKVARQAVFGPEKLPVALKKLEQLERAVDNVTVLPESYDLSGINNDRSLHAIQRFPVDGVYLFRIASRGFRPLGCDPLEVGFWLDGNLMTVIKVDPKEDGPSLLGGRQDLFGKPQDFKMFVTAGDHWVAGTVLRMYEGLPAEYGGLNPSPRHVPTPASQPTTAPDAPVAAAGAAAPAAPATSPANAQQPQAVALAAAPAPVADPQQIAGAVDIAVGPATSPATQQGRGARFGGRGGRGGRRGGGGGGGRGRGLPPADSQVGIDYIDVIGPVEQTLGPSPESIKLLYPSAAIDKSSPDAAKSVIANVARRAFRRPVTDADLAPYLKLYTMVRASGDSFDEGIVVAIQGILVSPDFLFRIEKDAPPKAGADDDHLINDFELASRLSYFLWSTMPDEQLFAVAANGTLRQPAVLEAQVQRMLKDPRSKSLAQSFAGQWLRTRALDNVTPEFKLFPEFDLYLRMSMREETESFVDYVVKEDRSILDFLDSNYTFLNERMAIFYKIPGVQGTQMQKVDLTDTSMRGGVLTQASVLTVSSYATRTSPVLRGKWVLENILNAPPPPPPNNVPPLESTMKNNPTASLREQLEMHRANPTCASCHARMDPLGMGLENFDAIGKWRTMDGEHAINASGVLPDGRSFNGIVEMKKILLADKDAFASCMADKLLTYALGRGLEDYDRPTVKEIAARAAKSDYHFSGLVLEIVKSLPFQKRTSAPMKTAQVDAGASTKIPQIANGGSGNN